MIQEKKLAEIMKQLLNVLNFLDNKKIMHRDIKPANIMLVNYNTNMIKLIDFGLAIHKDNEKNNREKMAGTVIIFEFKNKIFNLNFIHSLLKQYTALLYVFRVNYRMP